ncbi:Major Facilitator Superfamily protein [Terribacillus aidingensis]|uniref:Major Facilitator Superfamily protein n=1 Tax=Terribacillus aidingensis TaxID=586416 RepID=A0A285P7C2_9BACI|nr:MFS transporter [Terribacillus aidingensis]SNZ17093.1 Major Facilitator Superfamily protein [Terribacillus aidingensis]
MHALRSLHPYSWAIIIGTVFGRMATSMSIPFLAIYLTQEKGASAGFTGLIIAVSSLVGILASFYGGYFSDRFGRKKIMGISIFGWCIVFAGFGLADAIWVFFVMNALNGLCRSLFEPTSKALLSDVTDPKHRLLVFNMRYTAINVGVVFGPLLGLYFGSAASTAPFFIAALVYFVYGLVLIFQFTRIKVAETAAAGKHIGVREAFHITRKDKLFMLLLIGVTVSVFGYSHFSATLPQFFAAAPSIEDGAKLFSMMLTLNALTVLVVQYPIVAIAKRYSLVLSLMLGNILIAVSMLSMAFLHDIVWIACAVILFTIGEVLLFSMSDMFIDEIANPAMKGTYFGAMGFTGFGGVAGPLAGGMLLDYFGAMQPIPIFTIISFLVILGAPFLLQVWVMLKGRKQEPKPVLKKEHV